MHLLTSRHLGLAVTFAQSVSVMNFRQTVQPKARMPAGKSIAKVRAKTREPPADGVLAFLDVLWSEESLRFHEHAPSKPLPVSSDAELTKSDFLTAVGSWRSFQRNQESRVARPALLLRAYD